MADVIGPECVFAAGDVHHFEGVRSVNDPLWMTNYESVSYTHLDVYKRQDYIFKEALDNEVRCKVILFPKNDEKDTRPNTTTWYFKPVRFLGIFHQPHSGKAVIDLLSRAVGSIGDTTE